MWTLELLCADMELRGLDRRFVGCQKLLRELHTVIYELVIS